MLDMGRMEWREEEKQAIAMLEKVEQENPGFLDTVRAGLGYPVVPAREDFDIPKIAEELQPVFALLQRHGEMSFACREWMLEQRLIPPGSEEERQEFVALALETQGHDEEITEERKAEIRQRMLELKAQAERQLEESRARLRALREEE